MPLKTQYFTEELGVKLTVATGGASTLLIERWCSTRALSCQLASDYSLVLYLIGMMALDMLTGVIAARSEGARVTSRRLGEGMKRKVGMIAVICGALILGGTLSDHGLPIQDLLFRWTTSWFIAVEGLSLYENAERMGLRMPTFLKTIMERLLQRAEKAAEGALPKEG